MPHLFLAVTAHGYGHLAQCSPVVHALRERIPALRITLQGDIDAGFARRRLPPGFDHIREPADLGLVMDGPLRTLWAESLEAYLQFDAVYEDLLERQMGLFRKLAPDLVLADVPWLPLDAARHLGIPAIGLCSLSWYDILRECPVGERVALRLLERMRTAYAGADLFIRPAPSMPMDWLPNAVDVGPIARRSAAEGPQAGLELKTRIGMPVDRPLALMQFGGFSGFDPLADWAEQDQVHWLVQDLSGRPRCDASALTDLGLELPQVLGALDLMLAKPGYGSFAEAACNGVRLLYVSRSDWPEEPCLTEWIARRVPALEVGLDDLISGKLAGPIAQLLREPRPRPTDASGVEAAAELIAPLLTG